MLDFLRSLALAALLILPFQPASAWETLAQPTAEENGAPTEIAESGGRPSYKAANPVIQDYDPDPAIWRLADGDTTLYFFGTVHALPEGFRWRSPLLEEVIGKSDEIVFESRSSESSEDEAYATMLETIFSASTDRSPISARLSEDNRAKWRRLAQLTALDFRSFDYMPPSMSLMFISVATSALRGSEGEYGVETVLEREFRAAGKPIYAIEDPAAVLQSVIGLDEELALATLDGALSNWDGVDLAGFEPDMTGYNWRLEHLWALGIEDPQSFQSWMADPFSKALYKVLLIDRNRQWTDWIIDRMDRPGTVLIAVGGGHFEGPDAVQRLLAKKGYEVERLNPSTADLPSQLIEYSEN
ncbi:TraB/GumN family protein [Parerythrobacter aestuarii]|uniref:TraB/GumN family protein n=1 Tax=Parerythrobacter aestuarii TaxID=3020909 RepID=UPI0024DE8464|nr:TraB/GumN family protein [Parerythrobacter aestuarii]